MKRMSARLSVWAALLCVAMSGCASSGAESTGSTISGEIAYTGSAAGGGRPLAIAVYRTYPPSGPPVAWRLVENPKFPYRYTFDGLAPGNYVVAASVDVDPSDTRYVGMLNVKRDPHGYSSGGQLVHVDAMHGVAGMDVALGGGQ